MLGVSDWLLLGVGLLLPDALPVWVELGVAVCDGVCVRLGD